FPPGEVAVRALLAGADVLLLSPVTDAALSSVRDAIQSGRVPMSRLDDAVRRLLEAKARLGLYKQREVDVDKLSSVFGQPEFLATAADIAVRGVTLLRNDAGLVPLDPRTTKRVFLLAVSADPDTTPAEPFERELRAQLDNVDSLHVDTKYFRAEETHLPSPDSYDLAICAMTVRVADRKGTIGLPTDELEMIHALLKAGKPVIMVGLGSPYLMESFPEATTWLASFSVQDVAQRAAAQALLGTFAVGGRLPVSLPGAAPHALKVGDGMATAAIPLTLQPASAEMDEQLKPVVAMLNHADLNQVGGVLAVAYRGHLFQRRFGKLGAAATDVVATPEMLPPEWPRRDLPLDTAVLTTAIARLVQTKQLALESPLATILAGVSVWPRIQGWRELTLRQLLERPPELKIERPPSRVWDEKPLWDEKPPWESNGGLPQWSASSILASQILETMTGHLAPEAARMLLFGSPLPALATPPKGKDEAQWAAIEARANQLAVVGQIWLNGGLYAGRRLMNTAVERQFLVRESSGERVFTPGWDVAPAPGKYFSKDAFGSASPDGTSLWIDPAQELVITIAWEPGTPHGLSPLSGQKSALLRLNVHDAIFAALGLKPAN
ncbi:MAG TPA: glycoside hydrolase family 3 C-terminal domain-containing protein, partial [Verrucomicrobiae bacterium]|nr:glycoside hydrolase family 3 C-terminal domain-containing protein [Verrucomicrobiae bacterium]